MPAEGLSYVVVLGVVGWSAYTKATTGSGLPAGPAGLLGAVEGFSYLSLLAGESSQPPGKSRGSQASGASP